MKEDWLVVMKKNCSYLVMIQNYYSNLEIAYYQISTSRKTKNNFRI